MRKSFNLDMSIKSTNPNFKLRNGSRVSSTKSGMVYFKMNASKISPLKEFDRMYSFKSSDAVQLHKRFPDPLHKFKSSNCGSLKNTFQRKSSTIKPFVHSPNDKKHTIKVSIPIKYFNGFYKASILKTSKPMPEAKNDQISQVKSSSVSSNKNNHLELNFPVKSNTNFKSKEANPGSVKISDMVYLEMNNRIISPLKELDTFSLKNSDPKLVHKSYDYVGCNYPLSKSLPLCDVGQVAMCNTSENSSIIEFPMEWNNLDWGIDDYYQDITDYKEYYSKIVSKEQRDIYYADYTAGLQEYQKLHGQILDIKTSFEDLQLRLSACQRETKKYKEIHHMLEEKFKFYQKDHNFIYTRLRSNHLYKKLSYIQKLIKEFDEIKYSLPKNAHIIRKAKVC